jgi:nucleoside-diphosphate-sugar epimerase
MKYLVTGATGFIGGRIARQLIAAGHRVVTLAREPSRAEDLARLGAQVHAGDITDRDSLRAPMRGVDGVFHVAAWYRVGARDHSMARRINVDGTRHVLETMREQGVPRGVYTSTLAVFGDTHGRMPAEDYVYAGPHLSEYDATKWAAHHEVAIPMMREGLPLTIVQPGVVYGPGDTSSVRQTLLQYLGRRLPLLPAGTEFCWAHVDDVAHAHVLAMERGRAGECYIIAGERRSLIEAMRMAERMTGVPAPRLVASPGVLRAMAAVMDVVGRLVPLPESYTGEGLRVIAGVTYLGDNSKARATSDTRRARSSRASARRCSTR